MNFTFSFLFLLSISFLFLSTNANLVGLATESILASLNLCVSLLCIYMFWCAILRIVEDCKLNNSLARFINLPLSKIFVGASEKTKNNISLNLATNFLGISNASLPYGIEALKEMQNSNNVNSKFNQSFLACLNCISFQFFPTTILSIYISNGGTKFFNIWIVSIIVSCICICLCFLFLKLLFKWKIIR